MLWKFYFWVVSIVVALSVTLYLWYLASWTIYDWYTLVSAGIAVFILYSYIYNTSTLNVDQWKILFWVGIGLTLFDLVIYLSPWKDTVMQSGLPDNSGHLNLNEYIFYTILSIPVYYANYKLGYPNAKDKHSKKSS